MKKIKWIVLALVVLLIGGLGIVWANLNGIVRRTVETQASSSLDLKTTLGGANVSIFGGSVSLTDLAIGSPPGFSSPSMLSLDQAGVNVSLGQLRGDPVRIKQITIDKPRVVIEASGTKLNFQAIMDRQSKTPADPKSGEPEEPMKLIIDQLQVTSAQIALRPNMQIPGVQLKDEYSLTLPTIMMNNIGSGEGAENGAAIKEVVAQLLATMAARAAESDQLPAELRQILSLNADEVAAQINKKAQAEIGKQLEKVGSDLEKKLPGDLGKAAGEALKGEDAGKAIERGLQDVLGGKKKDDKKNQPATQPTKP